MKNNKIQKMILGIVLCSAMSFVNKSKADNELLSPTSAGGIVAAIGGVGIVANATLVDGLKVAKKIKNGEEVTRKEATILGALSLAGVGLLCVGWKIVSKIEKLK